VGSSLVLLFVVILLFPDGRLPSRFWRWTLRVFCAVYAALLVATAVATAGAIAAHPIRVDSTGGLSAIDPPGRLVRRRPVTGHRRAAAVDRRRSARTVAVHGPHDDHELGVPSTVPKS
jgi:hypothetical protein